MPLTAKGRLSVTVMQLVRTVIGSFPRCAAQQNASIQPRLDLPIDTYHILGFVDIFQYYKYNFRCHEPNRRRATPRRSVDDRPDAGRARREIGRIASDDQATRARPRSSSREACYAPEAPTR